MLDRSRSEITGEVKVVHGGGTQNAEGAYGVAYQSKCIEKSSKGRR